MAKALYTIGYAGFPDTVDFIAALQKYGVQIVIDVRSNPHSTHREAYDKEPLTIALKQYGIFYSNFARQFGARQENPAFYKNGRLDFETFSRSEQFQEGVESVEQSKAVIAFMCAEKEPEKCHRAILIGRAFSLLGHEVRHILANGNTETQEELNNNLLDEYFPEREGLRYLGIDSRTDDEFLQETYIKKNDEIGFRLEDLK